MVVNKFPITIYGEISNYNEVLSKARCRIFYKYGNRNGTYITDEFAEKLISTLSYVPVKGIYDSMADDYTDHGRERYEGRIYGIVPENPNFSWESHLDDDGIVREYACVDVLLFTGIYKKEAFEIMDKAQSMELYADSIKGDWKFIEGKRYFVYEEGCFLGLQVLGENVEPCFEGAAFFSLYDSLNKLFKQLEEYNVVDSIDDRGGEEEMFDKINFKLSDNQKYKMIFSLLNPNFNEDGGFQLDYAICDIYDSYALTFNLESEKYMRVYYSKDDATDSLEITNTEVTYVVDINEYEKTALENLHAMNGDTFEKVDEKFSTIETLETENAEFDQKIKELEVTIVTLNEEKTSISDELEEVKGNYTVASDTIETLNTELEGLRDYKLQVEKNEKLSIINSYSEQLDSEVLKTFEEKVDSYTNEELEKELAYTLVKSKPSLFSREPDPGFVPKDEELSGIEGILSKYEK